MPSSPRFRPAATTTRSTRPHEALAWARAALAHSIPFNVVAAYRHDHVFVPSAMAGGALAVLEALQVSAA